MGIKREKEEGEMKKRNKGRRPCCVREGVTKGAWTADEDKILVDYITQNGHGIWRNLPKLAGLLRCGKSCRLRWTNYLRPDIRRGPFTPEEENTIIHLHGLLGNKWAAIASHLAGRTDNDVKNFWNSHLRKRFELSSSSKPVDTKSGSVGQWESVRPGSESKGDYFMHLWNSKVGESFRNINQCGGAISHSPTSQSSSLTKVESANRPESEGKKMEVWICKKEAEEVSAFSDTSKSYEVDDSSDAMMKMLLDFPVGDDMAFLEPPPSCDVAAYTRYQPH